jgi:hypothetical protein
MTDNVTGICESKYILIYNLKMIDNITGICESKVDHHTTFANPSTFFKIFEYHDHSRRHPYFYNFPINMTRN